MIRHHMKEIQRLFDMMLKAKDEGRHMDYAAFSVTLRREDERLLRMIKSYLA